jgi:hypothetical protein
MKSKLVTLGFILILVLGALTVGGCMPPVDQPTEVVATIPVDQPTETVATMSVEVTPEGTVDMEFGIALDAAIAYVAERYGEQTPPLGLAWTTELATPEGVVGSMAYQYTAGDWVATVSCPVVAPDAAVYQVVMVNQVTGFQWQGEVDTAGQVTETLAPTAGQPVVGWIGRVVSLPAGGQFDDYLVLQPEGAGEIGLTGADNTAEAQIQMLRDSDTYAHFWGTLTCPVLDYGGCQLVVTRLREDRPGPSFAPDPVEGWEGIVVGNPPGSQFDDYFRLAGNFPVGYGIDSPDPVLAAQLADLRDTGTSIRVWGELVCPTINAFGTGISVSRIEVVGQPAPIPTPAPTPVESWAEPVEDWWGEIVSNPPGSQFDDYFQRQIVDGEQYGIESLDPNIQAQIVALRDTGTMVHVWGTLHHNVPDYNAAQIQVTLIEVPEPPEPSEITEEPVEGWVGTIGQLLPGSQFKDYFERDDDQRYGIAGANDAVREQIEMYRWTGAQVQVWGRLRTNVPAYEGRAIQVERIEAVSGPPIESRNLTPFATSSASSHLPTDHGGQYQSWMAMDGSLGTAWVEGVAGPGVGEWIQLSFPGTVEVHYINLDVGYDRDDDIFYANNRVKRVSFSFSTGEQIEMDLADARGMQMIVLARAPGPIETTFVRIVIKEVYPGSRHDDTCLAEIEIWGTTK